MQDDSARSPFPPAAAGQPRRAGCPLSDPARISVAAWNPSGPGSQSRPASGSDYLQLTRLALSEQGVDRTLVPAAAISISGQRSPPTGRLTRLQSGRARQVTGTQLRGMTRPSPAVGDPVRISLVGLSWVTGLRRPTRSSRWLNPAMTSQWDLRHKGDAAYQRPASSRFLIGYPIRHDVRACHQRTPAASIYHDELCKIHVHSPD
jgi:hypothetical protein